MSIKINVKKTLPFLLVILFSLLIAGTSYSEEVYIWNPDDLEQINAVFKGDFEELKKRRIIRVLIPYSKTFFFFDGARPRGASYDLVKEFEKEINKNAKSGTIQIHVLIFPTPREELIARIRDGKGDIAVGNLTLTESRQKEVDFSDPFAKGVEEILVSSADAGDFNSIFDLGGIEIFTRKSSSYYESLLRLNKTLSSLGKKKVKIIEADDHLEDEDLLEMVNSGLIRHIVMDNHKAQFWAKIFNNIKLQTSIKLRTGGKIGWVFRKNSPEMETVINRFVKNHKKGTLLGNILYQKYLKDTNYITNSIYNEHMQRFLTTVRYFEKYGTQYQFDHLMLAALGYQESKLDQNMKSPQGAIGVMQILPSTARDKNIGIANINEIEPNIHAGTKYLRFMSDRYFSDNSDIDSLNKMLFAFASYNAGPARIAALRKEAEREGLDKNQWFNNVEIIAARRIGRETVQYVSNIFKYYIAYTLISEKLRTEGPVLISDPPKKQVP